MGGQFGLVKGKAFPFDFDTHVPFFVRGPGITPGSYRNQPVLNIDLAPTFLDIAGLHKPPNMDGRSLLPTFSKPEKRLRDAFLIERGKMTFERYNTVTQAKDDAHHRDSVLAKDELSIHERLSVECKKPRYQAPCSLAQKWVCRRREDGSLKIGRCKTRRGEKREPDICHCNQGEVFGWKYVKVSHKKSKIFKNNLKLKLLARTTRSDSGLQEDMLEEVVHEEVNEVDFLVEDISKEIQGLHGLTNSSHIGCAESTNSISCNQSVVVEASTWVTSRNTIKHQIQQLRAQLNELKQIRKYLKLKRPVIMEQKTKVKSGSSLSVLPDKEVCFCNAEKNKEARKQQIREEREEKKREKKFERLLRKERKRKKVQQKNIRKFRKDDHCKTDVKMNCFSHDNNHWKTEPLWTEGPFCACTNSNNNTYWCVRNINSTHNYLYCEYVTGMLTYFDLKVDPFQLRNLLYTLTDSDLNYMHRQVTQLRNYSGKNRFIERKLRKQRLQKNHLKQVKRRKQKSLTKNLRRG